MVVKHAVRQGRRGVKERQEGKEAQRSTSGSRVAKARRGYEFVELPPWLIVTYATLPGNRLLANTVRKGAPDRGFRRARSLSPCSPSKKTRNSLPVVFAPRRFIHPSSTLHTYSLRFGGSIFRVWHGKFSLRDVFAIAAGTTSDYFSRFVRYCRWREIFTDDVGRSFDPTDLIVNSSHLLTRPY